MQTLALFDLDNTLLAGDSDHAWGEFLVDRGLVDGDVHQQKNDAFYNDYLQGNLDIDAYLRFALEPLTGKTPAELKPLHDDFMSSVITPMMQDSAFRLIDQHRQRGDRLLIITATNAFITAPIAAALGIDELLASEAELADGRYTGAPSGTPCFHAGKVQRLNSWLADNPYNLQDAWFYSDSHNDIPLLEVVGNPVAVDADETLLAHAKENGWHTLSLRTNGK